MNKQELIDFEADIAREFNAGNIRFPIHLSGGNEDALIDIFKDFRKGDFCFSSWRNHYHGLLAGIPPEEVKRQIMAGRSMTVCSPEHRFFSSAIVAGCCPIAVGVAWQIKQRGGKEIVWIFIGDMTALTGMALECMNYSKFNNLPIKWVIEDNDKSVCTPTRETLGAYDNLSFHHADYHYQFTLPWPHSGAGVRIQF